MKNSLQTEKQSALGASNIRLIKKEESNQNQESNCETKLTKEIEIHVRKIIYIYNTLIQHNYLRYINNNNNEFYYLINELIENLKCSISSE